jgi:hypothetical protein
MEVITPDEDGVRPFSINDIPKPPPLSVRQRLKKKFRQFRDRYYAQKLAGATGKLANGVTWRLSVPPPHYDSRHIRERGLILDFDDPKAGGMAGSGFHFVGFDFEQAYRNGLSEHIRKMKIRQLVPAEPGDPDGFFVMWECDAKKRQRESELFIPPNVTPATRIPRHMCHSTLEGMG